MEFTCVGQFSTDKVLFLANKPQMPTWPEFNLVSVESNKWELLSPLLDQDLVLRPEMYIIKCMFNFAKCHSVPLSLHV